MILPIEQFEIHDPSEFPIIRFRGYRARPGYAPQWQLEMELLLMHAKAFAILIDSFHGEEEHEDRKLRAIWLKQNKLALGKVCRAIASVEPDATRRQALAEMMAGAERAFGVPQIVAASEEAALASLRQALAR